MNPVSYSQTLVKKQGPVNALRMAEENLRSMEMAGSLGGSPFAQEVETSEHTYVDKETNKQKTRTITIIDDKAKDLRQAKTLRFWQNVVGYLKKNHPVKATA